MEAKNLGQNTMPHIVYASNDSSMKLFFYGITANLENHRHAWLLCFNEKEFATGEPLKKVGLLECRSSIQKKFEAICDCLAAVKKPVEDVDKQWQLARGLGPDLRPEGSDAGKTSIRSIWSF